MKGIKEARKYTGILVVQKDLSDFRVKYRRDSGGDMGQEVNGEAIEVILVRNVYGQPYRGRADGKRGPMIRRAQCIEYLSWVRPGTFPILSHRIATHTHTHKSYKTDTIFLFKDEEIQVQRENWLKLRPSQKAKARFEARKPCFRVLSLICLLYKFRRKNWQYSMTDWQRWVR